MYYYEVRLILITPLKMGDNNTRNADVYDAETGEFKPGNEAPNPPAGVDTSVLDTAGKIVSDPKKMNTVEQKAVAVLVPVAQKLRETSLAKWYDQGWAKLSYEDKKKALQDPTFWEKMTSGIGVAKHKVNQYAYGGLVLLGAIGSREDDALIKEIYQPGLAEKFIAAALNLAGSLGLLDAELMTLAKAINIKLIVHQSGLRVSEAVRIQSGIPSTQRKYHDEVAKVMDEIPEPANNPINPEELKKKA